MLAACAAARREAHSPGPARVTVLTYNVHRGVGLDGATDLERIAGVVRASGADLVALQEVDVGTRRSAGVDQASELGRLTGLHVAFGEAMAHDGGSYGEAVLSRWPVRRTRVHPLPHSGGREPRCALEVVVETPAGPLRFVGTHLDHTRDPVDRIAQVGALDALFADEMPTVLAGDFNDQPGAESLSRLADRWADVLGPIDRATYPADAPERAIDHVFVRPTARFTRVSAGVLDEPVASDHRPVRAVLEVRGE
ncbi:MAG TPA: endonuclease/exonuclease/phosphatase family protein [Planctomycetota bacterium]|nr:endonuclease/exonuclease/phosphatase family protein [Planctomycetota bacterium]